MNIKDLHKEIKEVSALPVFKSEHGTATAIQLQADGELKEHTSKTPALLLCVSGDVLYEDETKHQVHLSAGDYVNITPLVKHKLKAASESQLVLIK